LLHIERWQTSGWCPTINQREGIEPTWKIESLVKSERPKVLDFPLHRVKMALVYFLFRFPDEPSREEICSLQGTLIYFLRKKCWNWNPNFIGNLCAYKLVPDWVFNLCLSDKTWDFALSST
jgi:hypothetical protein